MQSLILLILIFTFSFISAQDDRIHVDFVLDVDTLPSSSNPTNFTEFKNQIVFIADHNIYGKELWISDENMENTRLVGDFIEGREGSDIREIVVFKDHFYFFSDYLIEGKEYFRLWKSNGLENGTEKVLDFPAKDNDFDDKWIIKGENQLYFRGWTRESGRELWTSDGTTAGSHEVIDIKPGFESNQFDRRYSFNDKFIFSSGGDMWISDGTALGTYVISSEYNLQYSSIGEINDYFIYKYWNEVWVTDGTKNGTKKLKDSGIDYQGFTKIQEGKMYFKGSEDNVSKIWVTDGTTENTISLFESTSWKMEIIGFKDGNLVFLDDRSFYEIDVEGNVAFIKEREEDYIKDFAIFEETIIYFTTEDEIYSYGGKDKEDELLFEHDQNVYELFVRGNRAYFVFREGNENFLYVCDGTASGTMKLRQLTDDKISSVSSFSRYPSNAISFKNNIIFTSWDSLTGFEPWISDGTLEGTRIINDVNDGTLESNLVDYYVLDDYVLYILDSDYYGSLPQGLFSKQISTGKVVHISNSVVKIKDGLNKVFFTTGEGLFVTEEEKENTIFLGNYSPIREFSPNEKAMFFWSFTELFISDGTLTGTRKVLDINIDLLNYQRKYLNDGTRLFFSSKNLWVSDGSFSGTFPLTETNNSVDEIVSANGRVYFTVDNEIWVSNGTKEKTYKIQDFEPGFFYNSLSNLTPFKGDLYFILDGSSLWKFDIIKAKYQEVLNDFSIESIEATDSHLVLPTDQVSNYLIWTTEGDQQTTFPLSFSAYGHYRNVFTTKDLILYSSNIQDVGGELVVSNGFLEGTFSPIDINDGEANSNPINFKEQNGNIYFQAQDEALGISIYKMTTDYSTNFSGQVFNDLNENQVKDPDEYGISNVEIYILEEDKKLFSNNEGYFSTYLQAGNNTLRIEDENCYKNSLSENELSININSTNESKELDIPMVSNNGESAVNISVNNAIPRCGFSIPVWINVSNNGCQVLEGRIEIETNKLGSYNGNLADFQIDSNLLTYNFSDLNPSQNIFFNYQLKVASEEHVGELLEYKARIYNYQEGQYILTDSFLVSEEIKCAIDPNDKMVFPTRKEKTNSNYTQVDEELKYTIRFQNVGNDTAINVLVEDQLSYLLDLETFRPISSSHNPEIRLDSEGKLSYYFRNILLVDSSTNHVLSNGFLTFGIYPKTDVADFSPVSNIAEIFFDFNKAIITNKVKSTLVEYLDYDQDDFLFFNDCDDRNYLINPNGTEIIGNGIDEDCDGQDNISTGLSDNTITGLKIYPNPTEDFIIIENSNFTDLNFDQISTIQLSDLKGRILVDQIMDHEKLRIDLNSFTVGMYILKISQNENSTITKIVKN